MNSFLKIILAAVFMFSGGVVIPSVSFAQESEQEQTEPSSENEQAAEESEKEKKKKKKKKKKKEKRKCVPSGSRLSRC